MKKILPFLFALLLAVPHVHADSPRFMFGLKASPNISWHRPETRGFERDGATIGFSYGLIADYVFVENYAISSGMHILHTGGKLKYDYRREDNVIVDKRREYSLRYLEFPLTIKLRTEEIGYVTYYGQFGLSLGFNTKAEADESIPQAGGDVISRNGIDISDETSFVRGAMVIGAGLEYNLGGRTSLMGGLVFNNGFSNVLKMENPYDINSPTPSSMINFLEITFGVMF
ncbi:MAG: porin family protein [Bacteroidales bacterium]